ncbi:MAG: heavy metal translocating P-type ATPase [Pseudomonadota bacterium]
MAVTDTGQVRHTIDRPSPAAGADVAGSCEMQPDGSWQLHLLVSDVTCGGCVRKVEEALAGEPNVLSARVNLSTRRLALNWQGSPDQANAYVQRLSGLGYPASVYRTEALLEKDKSVEKRLVMALAVAFFGAANVMMLAWAVWAGHFATMGQGTRDFFHWIAALIAVPCIYYSGQPFFSSAWRAMSKRQTNMDVPISVGVVLTTAMSIYETMTSGPHVYFDGVLMLLFLLLVGRYLDHKVRGTARSAVHDLAMLAGQPVNRIEADGTLRSIPPEKLARGDLVHIAAGERIGVDGEITEGQSSVDTALIDGETTPKDVAVGAPVLAGTMNLTGPLVAKVKSVGEATVLAEIVRLLEAAEQKKGRYRAFADKVIEWYSPTVHTLALAAFLGWWLLGGLDVPEALMIAVCVLIITCPCALGLAVPITQVVAAGKLSRLGVLVKSDTALERLATINAVIFDKTGTLTTLQPELVQRPDDDTAVRLASSMAAASRHPLSQAIGSLMPDARRAKQVEEHPGEGLAMPVEGGEARLGSARWCGLDADALEPSAASAGQSGLETEVWLTRPNQEPVRFAFAPVLRPDALETVKDLQAHNIYVEIVSGDRGPFVEAIADQLGIEHWQAQSTPADKIARIEALQTQGYKVLMVGDGLNDTPALAAADASLAPAMAADISRRAADLVFQGASLGVLPTMLSIAARTQRIVGQNIAFAIAYNLILIPVAVAGLVTPWIAAIAMALSSLIVTGNALRLDGLNPFQAIATRTNSQAAINLSRPIPAGQR